MTKNVAVAIIGYNRVNYLGQLIKSIERTEEKDIYPFHFFIDGSSAPEEMAIKKIIEDSSIKNKKFMLRRGNIGCGRNHIEAKIELFKTYDGVFVLEDDCTISKNFFKILSNLYDWGTANYNNIGIVQGYQTCIHDRAWKEERLDHITLRNDAWLGYFIPKETWNQIKQYVEYYYSNYLVGVTYKNRLVKKDKHKRGISTWIKQSHEACDKEWHEGNFKPKFTVTGVLKGTGQDAVMGAATYFCGLERVSTVVNHVKNIGIDGINCNQKTYDKLKLGQVAVDEFDTIPTEFKYC